MYCCQASDKAGAYDLAFARVNYTGDGLVIIRQPQSVTMMQYAPGEFPSATFTCEAIGAHPLEYTWQGKTDFGWQNFKPSLSGTKTFKESQNDYTYYALHHAYRCIVRDTVTNEEVTSEEAQVIWPPLEITGLSVNYNNNTVTVSAAGGKGPYSIEVHPSGRKDDKLNISKSLSITGGDGRRSIQFTFYIKNIHALYEVYVIDSSGDRDYAWIKSDY